MKFLVDMGLSPTIVGFLENLGHDAVRVNQLGMATASDEEIIAYATGHDSVVLTVDLDFGDILSHTELRKPSVIIFRLKEPSTEKVQAILESSYPQIEVHLKSGSIVVIDEYKIRIRELPIIREG